MPSVNAGLASHQQPTHSPPPPMVAPESTAVAGSASSTSASTGTAGSNMNANNINNTISNSNDNNCAPGVSSSSASPCTNNAACGTPSSTVTIGPSSCMSVSNRTTLVKKSGLTATPCNTTNTVEGGYYHGANTGVKMVSSKGSSSLGGVNSLSNMGSDMKTGARGGGGAGGLAGYRHHLYGTSAKNNTLTSNNSSDTNTHNNNYLSWCTATHNSESNATSYTDTKTTGGAHARDFGIHGVRASCSKTGSNGASCANGPSPLCAAALPSLTGHGKAMPDEKIEGGCGGGGVTSARQAVSQNIAGHYALASSHSAAYVLPQGTAHNTMRHHHLRHHSLPALNVTLPDLARGADGKIGLDLDSTADANSRLECMPDRRGSSSSSRDNNMSVSCSVDDNSNNGAEHMIDCSSKSGLKSTSVISPIDATPAAHLVEDKRDMSNGRCQRGMQSFTHIDNLLSSIGADSGGGGRSKSNRTGAAIGARAGSDDGRGNTTSHASSGGHRNSHTQDELKTDVSTSALKPSCVSAFNAPAVSDDRLTKLPDTRQSESSKMEASSSLPHCVSPVGADARSRPRTFGTHTPPDANVESETTLRAYMRRNHIPELFDHLSTDLLSEKPDDPVKFVLTWLRKQRQMVNGA